MADTTIPSHSNEAHSLTNGLRFVERNGRMILQQQWLVQRIDTQRRDAYRHEWRDVPIAQDDTP